MKRPEARWPSAEAFAAELDAARARPPMVPAPQRAFLREWERVGAEVATATTAAVVAAASAGGLTLVDMLRSGPGDNSILAWIFVLIAVLPAGLAKARMLQVVSHARALRRRGVDHRRILVALARESGVREEERTAASEASAGGRSQQWWLLGGTAVGSVGSMAMALSNGPAFVNLLGIAGAVVLPTLALRTAARLNSPDGRERWWNRLLAGRFGRWLFRARGDASSTPDGAALEGPEPTALALGGAARALYDALPAPAVEQLGPGVPSLIDALERRALEAREAEAAGAVADPSAVTALENLRLDLLRLSLGRISAERLTAELDRVREVGDAVERQLRAADEVESLLARERTPA